jgi:tungstate transport system substrate-binding protein
MDDMRCSMRRRARIRSSPGLRTAGNGGRRTRVAAALLVALASVLATSACGDPAGRLVLATTSSAYDSGLLPRLAEAWRAEEAPPALHVLVTGSGEALALARRGDADVLLVHAPDAEAAFMAAGHGVLRLPVMSSDFVIVGPAHDPAGVGGAAGPVDAFRRIAEGGIFASRGDGSGTHLRELQVRAAAGLPPEPAGAGRVLEVGQGMGETLRMASERRAYTLSDRATFEAWRHGLSLVEFPFEDPLLDNPYSVIVPSGSRDSAAAGRFARWLAGPRAQAIIADFRGPGGAPLFMPARGAADAPADGAADVPAGGAADVPAGGAADVPAGAADVPADDAADVPAGGARATGRGR